MKPKLSRMQLEGSPEARAQVGGRSGLITTDPSMPNNCDGEVELFTEAINLPTEERFSFLDRACAGNQDLRRGIEKLLRDHDRAGEFMEAPLTGSINELRSKISAGEKSGDRIGRYKLLQQIGEGGCGIVFVAEQQEPVRRRVALKVIKPGMDTKNVIARFEVERQALALMDHSSITRVFDAGATENGRPYFVMELVDGVKITDWAGISPKRSSPPVTVSSQPRDPRRLEELVKKYGDQARTAALDVVDEDAASAAVRVVVDEFGRLDVVVNNAGYGDVAPFEQLSSERFKAVVDTNFYGVVNVTRAALPVMRKQRSGVILQISSLGGRLAVPGSAAYHAAKWAVGGFTESLAQEVAPFGVKVCTIEPGGMRTNWGARAHKDIPDLLPEYEPSVGAVVKTLHSLWGQENSDPAKVAQVVLRLASSESLPPHLLIGSDAIQFASQAEATRAADAQRWLEVSVSTDFGTSGALPSVRF